FRGAPMVYDRRVLPSVEFRIMTPEGTASATTEEIFSGRNAILFGVVGAFMPACHYHHLPGFIEKRDRLTALGIDLVACTATNDIFVLDEWAKATDAQGKILFLSDGNGDFARMMGLLTDIRDYGLGVRSRRFAMWVVDLAIRALHVEPDPDRADFTSAKAMIR